MRQLSLTYDAATVGAGDWDAELGWFRRAVDVVGAKEVAYRLDIAGSHLSDAMKEAERKNVHGRWISIVRHMVPEAMLAEHLALIAGKHGYKVERIKPFTPDEQLRAEHEWMRRNAPGLLDAMAKELGT